jgi:hypothetical protein
MNINMNRPAPTGWSPPGMKVPKNKPSSIIALSHSLKHLEVKGEKEDVFRCPICGVPYEDAAAMQNCVAQPYDRTLRNNIGVDVGDPITFIAVDRKRRRAKRSGTVHEVIAIRSPRGHEDMIVVRWMNGPITMLESVLLPEPPDNVLIAIPAFTRDVLKTRSF